MMSVLFAEEISGEVWGALSGITSKYLWRIGGVSRYKDS